MSKKIMTMLTAVLCCTFMALPVAAQPYPAASYQLSSDGATLEKWLGDETEIDLTKDAAFDKVTSIASKAFNANRELLSVILPNSTQRIESEAFADCAMLTTVTWSDALTFIGTEAFLACKKLASIDLKQVEELGGSAFSGCHALKCIYVPKTLTTIGEFAFYNCNGLERFEVERGNDVYSSIDGVLFSDFLGSLSLEQYPRAKKAQRYVIPPTVLNAGPRSFDGCKNLKNLVIGSGFYTFNENALFNCSNLEKIEIYRLAPPQLDGTDPLYNIDVANCKLLVPEESIQVYKEADGWKEFASIDALSFDGILPTNYFYDGEHKTILLWVGTEEEIDMTKDPILSQAERIADDAFGAPNTTLLRLTLPTTMKEIGNDALWCTSMEQITLNEGLEKLGTSALSGMKVTSVQLPATLTSYAPAAIYNCFYLTDLTVAAGNPRYEVRDNMLLEKATQSLVFYPLGKREDEIRLPEGIKAIGDMALYDDIFVEKIIVPEGVTTIGDNALASCDMLTECQLPSTTTKLGNDAFAFSNELQALNILSVAPPEAVAKYDDESGFSRGTFAHINREAILYVPKGSVNAYKANPVYEEAFADIRPLEDSPLSVVSVTAVSTAPSIHYDGASVTIQAEGAITLYDINGICLAEGHDVLTVPVAKGTICLVVAGGGVQKVTL